jgi:hypothetical protein
MRRAPENVNGPKIFPLSPMDMKAHSVVLQSAEAWKNITGNFSVTLNRPVGPDVELYLMAR